MCFSHLTCTVQQCKFTSDLYTFSHRWFNIIFSLQLHYSFWFLQKKKTYLTNFNEYFVQYLDEDMSFVTRKAYFGGGR